MDDIVARDAASGALWFTGPPSFTALAARDRRTLLALSNKYERALRQIIDMRGMTLETACRIAHYALVPGSELHKPEV